MSYFFPPEVTALFGHMGIELDPVKESQEEKQGFEHYVKLHKALRPLLHSGTTWRIPSEDKAHQIHAVVSQDKSQAVVLVSQLAMPTYSLSGHLRIVGLDPESTYQVSVIDKPENFNHIVGLTMPILDAESAILIELKRVS